MTAIHLLSELRRQGVIFSVDNNRLRLRAPKGVLTPELRGQLVDKKEEILAVLRSQLPATESVQPLANDEASAGLIQDRHVAMESLEDNGHATWFRDTEGITRRHFPYLDRSFPVEVVRPGDLATCTKCRKSYLWLPFPALANICRDCQPPSIGPIPDPCEPGFEGSLESRKGQAYRPRTNDAGKAEGRAPQKQVTGAVQTAEPTITQLQLDWDAQE